MDNSQVTIDINADTSGFKRGTAEAKASLDSLSSTLKQPAAALKDVSNKTDQATASFSAFGIGVGLAAAAASAAILGLAKKTIDTADALNDMHLRTDVSVHDLASLKTIAEQSGTSLNAVAAGMQHLTVAIGQAEKGNKEYARALQDLGVTSKDPKEALYQLADAVKANNDPNRIATDLQTVLTRNYRELLPMLKEGGDSLRQSAQASESFADAMARLAPDADRFNDEIARLKNEAAGASAQLMTALVPSLADTATRVRELLDEDKGVQALVRAFAGLGKLPFDLLIGDTKVVTTAKDRIAELRAELGQLERNKASGNGKLMQMIFGTPEDIDRQITVIKNQITALEKFGDKIYPKKATTPKADSGIDLSAAAGKPKHISDPLASLLASTDIGKLAEFDKQVALLNQRFDYGRKSTELYSQAMTKLVQGTFSNNFKEAANDAEFMAMVAADGAKTTAEWNKNLRDLANAPLGRLNDLLKNTDFSRLQKDQEDMVFLTKAFTDGITDADGNLKKLSESQYLDAVKNRLNLVGKAAEDNNSLVKELGLTFTSAFEDAVVGGKKFSDVLKSLGQDIEKILLRKTVTEPLVKGLGSMDWGAIIRAILPSAQGNVFPGQTGLSAYRNTVVTRPTMFAFAQGAGIVGEKANSPGEGIFPMTRMSNGDLGVSVKGGGATVIVNLIESPG
ncbi:MAG: hypothetical protein ACYCZR_14265, partial [Burkholderiales bacterium]